MKDLNVEDYYETDSSDAEEKHSKLISSVSQLDSTQRVKPAQRKEATSKVSEYNLTERISSKENLINANELASVLNKSSKHVAVAKKFKRVTSKSKTLPKPLQKPQAEQIKRSVGFENVKNQLRRWDAVVTRNALKDQVKFPLNDNSMTMQKSEEFLDQFQCSTPLEEEIMKILNQEKKEEKQEDKEFSLTLEEMLEKRKEMAFLRAKLSHREAKAQRQNKIKSKKYHRILRREKLRQQFKEFEFLQKTDPEAALKKLSELDKTRAQERATLRHRNTGQWAKNLSVRAKYNVESRKILAEQLKISKELTQKVHEIDESDKEELYEPPPEDDLKTTAKFEDNPWNINISKEVQDFVSGYKKYWSEQNKTQSENATTKESKEIAEQDIRNEQNRPQSKNATNKESKEVVEQDIRNDQNRPQSKNTTNKESKEVVEQDIRNERIRLQSKNATNKESKDIVEQDIRKSETEKGDSCTEIQKPAQINKKKLLKNKKESEKPSTLKNVKSVSIYPGSGVWIVTPDIDESHTDEQKKKNIDTLFEELDEKLLENAQLKLKKIENTLKKKRIKKLGANKNTEKEFDMSFKNKSTVERPDLDAGLLENDDIGLETQLTDGQTIAVEASMKSSTNIDPEIFIQVKPKRLRTYLPDNVTNGEENDEKRQVMSIEEAFVDDDVIAEFREMKEDAEKNKEIVIETSLPGWGKWGGSGIVSNSRKRPRLIINAPPRKDKEKKDIIINENANPNLKNHKVKEVPHPFQSVEAFEASIRVPVGREWVPETAHWKLIQKEVETKLGAVIDPMDEDEIVRQKKNYGSPYQGKKKNQEKKIT